MLQTFRENGRFVFCAKQYRLDIYANLRYYV